MASIWQQLKDKNYGLSIAEALKQLVDEEGMIDWSGFDPEVNRRFRSHFKNGDPVPEVIPLLLWQNRYYLGCTTELSAKELERLKNRTGFDIQVVKIAERCYMNWLAVKDYDINASQTTGDEELFSPDSQLDDLGPLTENYLRKCSSPPEQLDFVIKSALRFNASDIHLEPTAQGVRVRYRIDGIMQDITQIPGENGGKDRRLINVLKVLCNMDIADNRSPQDGNMRRGYSSRDTEVLVDMRVSTYPSIEGEKAVIRLLPQQQDRFTNINNLGFTPEALKKYKNWLEEPHGMIIITGPTGSGKTSTLYASLRDIKKEDKNVVTIEDPIEYTLAGITQGQVNIAAGMTLEAGLRAILRQDPDIIMVGEIRDKETADTAVRAAQTGHLVFTTVHTNDVVSVITRLKGLGLDPDLLSDALLGIVAQRLVRKVCQYCSQPYEPIQADLDYLKLDWEEAEPENWRIGIGCPRCAHTGYSNREALVELLDVNLTVKQYIRDDRISDLYQYLSLSNFDSFRLAAIKKVKAGITTVKEIRRVLSSQVMH